MKKIFSFVLCVATTMMVSAQLVISPMGMMNEVGFQAENMSPDASSYVAGANQLTSNPAIWDVAAGEVIEFSAPGDTIYMPIYAERDSIWIYTEYDYVNMIPLDSIKIPDYDYETIVGYDSTQFEVNGLLGSFHAVNNNGLAVGTFGQEGQGFAVMATPDADDVTYLYADIEEESGSDAWGVSADGSVIVGFYFNAAWQTIACYWTNNGTERHDLPLPTESDFGGPVDVYYEARWVSADASVILGFVSDFYNGALVMIYWTRNNDGTYAVHSEHANRYFTPYTYDFIAEATVWVNPNNPCSQFEPFALSANGEWVTLKVEPTYDLSDWSAYAVPQAARLNLLTDSLEILPVEEGDLNAPEFFGIADNGTAVGATPLMEVGPGPLAPGRKATAEGDDARMGMIWFVGDSVAHTLQEIYPNEVYFNADMADYAISSISADGAHIVGYSNQTDGVSDWVVTSFIATLPTVETGVQRVESEKAPSMKFIENGQVIILHNGARFNMIGQKIR